MNATRPAQRTPLRVILVDPSLFTAPYDAALTQGLLHAGVEPVWATRPTRRGDRQEIPLRYTAPFFYKRVDGWTALPGPLRSAAKGAAHAWGLVQLLVRVWRDKPDVVHVQWVVLPPLDVVALWLIRLRVRLVLTVHDTVPLNGSRASLLQRLGFDLPIRVADVVIVHTPSGKSRLVERGIDGDKITVVAHGPLTLPVRPTQPRPARDARWTFVLFGELKSYKGLDLLVESLGQLPDDARRQCRLIVAGRARMDVADIVRRIDALALNDVVELRLARQSEQKMADLFRDADSFVFPYRQVDASGVYFLVKGLGKWLIASRVGIFADDLREGEDGALVAAGDVAALSAALLHAIRHRPQPTPTPGGSSWDAIGEATRSIYTGGGRLANDLDGIAADARVARE